MISILEKHFPMSQGDGKATRKKKPKILAITTERLDGDAYSDITYLKTDGALTGTVEVLFANPTSGYDPPVPAATGVVLSTNGPATTVIAAILPIVPRASLRVTGFGVIPRNKCLMLLRQALTGNRRAT